MLGWGGTASATNLIVGITQGTPAFTTTLTTTLSSTSVVAGTSFTDKATIAGGGTGATAPTGTITWFYTTGSTCPATSGATSAGSVTVSGNGVYTSPSITIGTAGTYNVYAVYSGDSNNLGSASACEPITVTPHTTGAPQFPAGSLGMLAMIALMLPALLLLRRKSVYSPTTI
jgi:hypothetical protein